VLVEGWRLCASDEGGEAGGVPVRVPIKLGTMRPARF